MMRDAALTQVDRDARRRKLEHRLAIDMACMDIESYCLNVTDAVQRPGQWWHTLCVTPDDDPGYADGVREAVEYLDLCGLLEHWPQGTDIVRLKLECMPR